MGREKTGGFAHPTKVESEAPCAVDIRTPSGSERNGDGAPTAASWASALHDAHADELRRFIVGVIRDRDAADDVVQTAFAKLIDQGQAVPPESRKSWLFQVAYREALARRRKQSGRDRIDRRLWERQAGLGWADATLETADRALIRSETIAEVRQALSELPEDQRDVVIARIHEGRTFAEIAEREGLSLSTVATRMRLALEKLRRRLRTGDGAHHD